MTEYADVLAIVAKGGEKNEAAFLSGSLEGLADVESNADYKLIMSRAAELLIKASWGELQ